MNKDSKTNEWNLEIQLPINLYYYRYLVQFPGNPDDEYEFLINEKENMYLDKERIPCNCKDLRTRQQPLKK